MLPNFDQDFQPNINPHKGNPLTECLFCYKSFTPNPVVKEKIKVGILSDLFNTFSNYMKWESPQEHQFDFRREQFPFCSSCSNSLVRVFKLDEQIQIVISDIISTVIDSQKHFSKNKLGRASEKMEFYRRQTIDQHQPPILTEPEEEEFDEPAALQNVLCNGSEKPIFIETCSSHNETAGPPSSSAQIPDEFQRDEMPNQSLKNPKKKNTRSFVCTQCGSSYKRKYCLTRHTLKVHTAESDKPFPCQICCRKFDTKSMLKEHMRGHKKINCSVCNKIYRFGSISEHRDQHKDSLSVSVSSSAGSSEKLPRNEFKCKLCRQSFPIKLEVSQDVQSCRNDTTCSDTNSARDQTKISAKRKPLCKFCSKTFSSRASLMEHVLGYHTLDKDKAFKCRVCGKKYASKNLLKRHFRVHERVECDICNRNYSVNSLYEHKYLMHKSVECTICRKTFSVDSIKEHAKWHKEQNPQVRAPASHKPCKRQSLTRLHRRRRRYLHRQEPQPLKRSGPVEAAEKGPCTDSPGKCQTADANQSVPTVPLQSGSSEMLLSAAVLPSEIRPWSVDRVQQLGNTKFIYDNKYVFRRLEKDWQCSACERSYSMRFDLLLHWYTGQCFGSQQPLEIVETFPSHPKTTVPKSSSVQKPDELRQAETSNTSLNKSQQNHQKEDERVYVCPHCGVSLKQRYSLHRHIQLLHTDESCKTFGCQSCSRKFATNCLLKDHMRSHKMLPCPICGEIVTVYAMYNHKKSHAKGTSSTAARTKL